MAVAASTDRTMAESSWLGMLVLLARAILKDRATRRKWLGSAAMLLLVLFSVGLWGIPGWLAGSALRFGLWWLMVAGWTFVVMLFALYDALVAIREERDRMK
jgi:hypothetical protein